MCYDLPRAGRKLTMVFSSAAMAASLFVFVTINSQAANIGVNAMEVSFIQPLPHTKNKTC